jgi:hypothetical protein
MLFQEKETLYEIGYKASLEFIPKRLEIVDMAITELRLKFTDPKV